MSPFSLFQSVNYAEASKLIKKAFCVKNESLKIKEVLVVIFPQKFMFHDQNNSKLRYV